MDKSVNSHEKQTFLDRLTEITEKNLTNNQFGVSELAKEMGMSRSLIHRKLKSYTNQSVSQYIRSIRLQKAMDLLRQNKLSAAEIAYEVGFSSPAYFNFCFHEEYGFPPGEVKKKIWNKEIFTKDDKSASDPLLSDTEEIPYTWKHILKSRIFWIASIILIAIALSWILYYFHPLSSFFEKNVSTKYNEITLAIPPFITLSNDPENEYIAEGIREDILNDLHWITSMRILPKASAEQFRGSEQSIYEIARKLKVNFVLDGSIRIYDDKIRINVQLIDPYREKHLWTSRYDRELENIIGIQDELAIQVASRVKAVLSENEIRQINKIPTQNSLAYDYYLRGRFLLHKANSDQRSDFDLESVQNCIQYFEKAIAEDENFAKGYAALANAWFSLSAWGYLPANEGFPKAKSLSDKAIKIDPECAEAYAIQGAFNIWVQRNFEDGRKELETSINLNPNFATSRQWYAQLLMITGPIEEARTQVDIALDLEPYFWVVQNLSAWIYYFEEKHEDAIQSCFIAKDLKPHFIENEWLFFLNYAKLGKGEEAASVLQEILKHHSGTESMIDEVTKVLNQSGIKGLFELLIDINKNRPIPDQGLSGHPFYLAWWNAILGNKDETLYWLERNVEAPRKLFIYLNLIVNNPDFKFLHKNPRFIQIVDQIGLSSYLR